MLEHELRRGSMGSVWQAYDKQLQRKVAVKFMQPKSKSDDIATGSDEWSAWFQREALALARLQHQNVIQVFDVGVDEQGRPFIVMELLEGEDLAMRLRRVKQLPLSTVVPIVTQVAKALDAAHANGVLHRDLKPANIFLARQGNDVVVKILDFGVAAMMSAYNADEKTRVVEERRLVGTPSYMSPEQASSGTVDHRSDLWSLAVVAYEALTGQRPFDGDSMIDVLHNICTMVPQAPSELLARPPSNLDAFFQSALAKVPSKRFADGREMAASFAKLLQGGAGDTAIKILIIDDEPDMEMLVRQRFRRKIRRGVYDFLFAGSGAEALERLQENPDIELAVTDINMPVMDGFSFLERVESISPTVRTIVVSAYGDMENIRRAMNYGAFDFLTKPIDFQDFEATLAKGVHQVRELRTVLHTMAENRALRMLVAPPAMKRLLPFIDTPQREVRTTQATLMAVRIPIAIGSEPTSTRLSWLNNCFDAIASGVSVFGGRVLRFFNTTLIAEFDNSQPLEDAICAGLRVQETLAGDRDPTADTVVAFAFGTLVSATVGAENQNQVEYSELGDPLDALLEAVFICAPGQLLFPGDSVAKLPTWCGSKPVARESSPRSDASGWHVLQPSPAQSESQRRAVGLQATRVQGLESDLRRRVANDSTLDEAPEMEPP